MAQCEDCDKHMHIIDYEKHLPCKGKKHKVKPLKKSDNREMQFDGRPVYKKDGTKMRMGELKLAQLLEIRIINGKTIAQ